MSETKLATAFAKAEDSPGLLLWQLSNKWQAQQRAALKPFDLTHVQFVLLAALAYAHGHTTFTQKQLAEYAQTDVMMTSQVLRKLEDKGLVTREPHTQDKRAFTLAPTPAGIQLANQAIKQVEVVDQNFFAAFGADQSAFIGIMRRLIK